jgi:intein-encoded DNA endonuclease-like protein
MQQKNERSKRKSHFISKDYVKGFFDEEGCVYVKQKQIIITNTNQELLKEISGFLRSLGICSSLEIHRKKDDKTDAKQFRTTRDCYRLRIFGYFNLKLFSDIIGSNDVDKRKRFRVLLNSYKRIPLSDHEKEQIRRLRKQGLTLCEIAERTGRAIGSVFLICSKN